MHRFIISVRSASRLGMQAMALALSLHLLLPATAVQAADRQSAGQAIESPRARESLLLGITRAGKRLVAVGERGHVLYSDDEGASWQQGRVPVRQMLTAVFFVDDKQGWAVGHDALILHSSDGGESWNEQYRDSELEAPLLDVWFADALHGFAVGAYGSVLHTRDGGASWEDVADKLDNEDDFHLNAIARIKDAGLFIVGEMGAMFRSTDEGESWEAVEGPYEGSLFGVLATARPQTLLAYGLRGHLFRSVDFGDSWQEVVLQTPAGGRLQSGLADGALLDDGQLLVVGHGGTLLRSTDHGESFVVQQRAERLSYAGVAGLAGGQLLLIGQGGIHQISQE